MAWSWPSSCRRPNALQKAKCAGNQLQLRQTGEVGRLGSLGKKNGLKVVFKGKDLATKHRQGDDRMARLTYFP